MKQIKSLRLFFLLGLVIAVGMSVSSPASAATTTTVKKPLPPVTIVEVGTVDIRNAVITKQAGNVFTVDFDLTNQVGAQPNLQYAVLLLQQTQNKTAQSVVDTKVYDDVVSLTGNDEKHISATYTAPSFLKGNYILAVQVKNNVGFPIGTVPLGTVVLQGSGEYINIDQSSCYLTVPSDATSTKYSTIEGVDVLPSENIIAHCNVQSTFNQGTTVVPSFVNYYRAAFFGAFIASTTQDNITLAPGVTSESFTIPKAKDPQAYDAVLTLLDSQGNQISNSAIFHYVIVGESATIQNIVFDKDSYAQGDIAKLSFFWSGAADSHPGGRISGTNDGQLTLAIRILNGLGAACSNASSETVSATTTLVTLAIPIIAPCINPNAEVSLSDASGNVLASSSFSVQSAVAPSSANNSSPITAWVLGIGVVVVLGGVAYVVLRKKKVS